MKTGDDENGTSYFFVCWFPGVSGSFGLAMDIFSRPVPDPDLELRMGPGFVLLALPAFLLSVFFSFFTQNERAPPLDRPL